MTGTFNMALEGDPEVKEPLLDPTLACLLEALHTGELRRTWLITRCGTASLLYVEPACL